MWLCDELGMEKNSRELHVVTPLHLRKFEVLSRQEKYNDNTHCVVDTPRHAVHFTALFPVM